MGYQYWDGIPRKADDPTRIAAYIAAQLALQDALSELGDVNIPAPNDGEALIYNAATSKWIASAAPGAAAGEGHITILPFSYDSIGQGTWVIELGARFLYGSFHNSSGADGDNISYEVYLDAGTYTFLLLGRKGPAAGILDFDIDAAEIASFDMYSGTWDSDQRLVDTGNVIASAGLKTVRARLDGKNASSTGYSGQIQYIALWRTA